MTETPEQAQERRAARRMLREVMLVAHEMGVGYASMRDLTMNLQAEEERELGIIREMREVDR